MLEPIRHVLNTSKIILASASPRRKEILEECLGIRPDIRPSTFAEDLDKSLFADAGDYVMENARIKALEVARKHYDDEWLCVIGADTIVELNNTIIEKPADKADAFRILKSLANGKHCVKTGVTLIKKKTNNNNRSISAESDAAADLFDIHTFYDRSDVEMADYDDDVINGYIETGQPMDKAGAYGIQKLASSMVKSIHGDFYNVMGFPTYKFAVEFKRFLLKEAHSKK